MTSVSVDNPAESGLGETIGPRRALTATMRRHVVLLAAIFCLAWSTLMLLAPLLPRTYELAGHIQVKIRPFAPLPALAEVPRDALDQLEAWAKSAHVQWSLAPDGTVRIATADPARETASERSQAAALRLSETMRDRAAEIVAAYRTGLSDSADTAAKSEQQLFGQITQFRLDHRGALPDDPTSTLAQFDKLATRLDERRQRLAVVTQQIKRLQDYRKTGQLSGNPGVPPPPLPATENDGESPARPVHPENDPEVAALTAQLQLLADQVDEQLNTMHRTEQHPYVIDLRNQQAALQKKLEAAKRRAAAGKPPPADARAPEAHPADSGAAGGQTVDLQIAALQAERDALDPEVRELTAKRDAMQPQVDAVLPIRQQYEALNAKLAAAKKQREDIRARAEELNQQFGAAQDHGTAAAWVESSPLALNSASTFPAWPNWWWVCGAILAMSAAAAALAIIAIHFMDRSLHSPEEAAAAMLGVPILGAVAEIRSAGKQKRGRLWRVVGRPLTVIAFLALSARSAVLCYRHLADPEFANTAHQNGVTSLLLAGGESRAP